MRAVLTAVIAAIEAAAVALAGIAVIAIPALLLWTITFELAAEPADTVAAALAVWLLGHFVPLGFELSAEAALGLGLPGEALSFTLSLAPLGVTLITAVLAARSGWRFGGRGGAGAGGVIGGALGFAGVAGIVAPLVGDAIAWSVWLAVLVPALVYGVCSGIAYLVRAAVEEHPWWRRTIRAVQRGLERSGVPAAAVLPSRGAETLRLAAAALTAYLGLSALAVAAAIVVGYVDIISLSQSLQLDPLGAILLFLLQLVLLPVAVVWAGAWIGGSGFAIGAGSTASPFGAALGPLPSLPLFGAIPQGWGSAAPIAPAVLVLAGVALGAVFASRPVLRRAAWTAAILVPLCAALLAGLVIAGLSLLASGSIGPDRLAVAGVDPWIAGGLAAAELGGGMLLGSLARRVDTARVGAALPDAIPGAEVFGRLRERVRPGDAQDAQDTVEITGRIERAGSAERLGATAAEDLSVPGGPAAEDAIDTEDAIHTEDAIDTEAYETEDLGSALGAGAGGTAARGADARDPDALGTEAYDTDALDPEMLGAGSAGEPQSAAERNTDADTGSEPGAGCGAESDADPDDELLRAYAWDVSAVDPDPKPDPPARRFPWRR